MRSERFPQKFQNTASLSSSLGSSTTLQPLVHTSLQHEPGAVAAMVTTRRQSKDFEPVEIPLVKHQKRKRNNDAEPTPSIAQPPKKPLTKRRKKVKSTAKADKPPVRTAPAPAKPAKAARARLPKKSASASGAEDTAHRQISRTDDAVQPKTGHITGLWKAAALNLTQDSDSSADDRAQRPHPVASRDADDEEADSRYALGSRRKDKVNKIATPVARQTAELKFEDDGLEEVDKAEVAIAGLSKSKEASRHSTKRNGVPLKLVNDTKTHRARPEAVSQTNGQQKRGTEQKKAVPPPGVPSRTVMFTILEAIEALALYKDGTLSVPSEIDPQSRQPYEPLQTGDFLSYPVKGIYRLGALGRFGNDIKPSPPFSLTVPLSEYSIVHNTRDITTAESSRHGLGFASIPPTRSQASAVRRPNNYCFTWGKYRGRRMDSVPITYLRSILNSNEYNADAKLQQAFVDLYPKGLYESEAESYTFEKGGFKGKRLDEVPKSYLWGLLRKMNEGEAVGGKKGRGRLERALEVWEKGQLDLTRD